MIISMSKSNRSSFLLVFLYYKRLTQIDFFQVKFLDSHISYELCIGKDSDTQVEEPGYESY